MLLCGTLRMMKKTPYVLSWSEYVNTVGDNFCWHHSATPGILCLKLVRLRAVIGNWWDIWGLWLSPIQLSKEIRRNGEIAQFGKVQFNFPYEALRPQFFFQQFYALWSPRSWSEKQGEIIDWQQIVLKFTHVNSELFQLPWCTQIYIVPLPPMVLLLPVVKQVLYVFEPI